MGIVHELYVYPNSENLLFGYFGHYTFGTRVIDMIFSRIALINIFGDYAKQRKKKWLETGIPWIYFA